MATIEYIQKRIEGKEKEISKLEKKLARIRKAEATGWTVNPYYYHEDDIRWTERDLTEARNGLAKYQNDLQEAQEKANSRNVTAILDFLEAWKKRVTEFYGDRFAEYPKAYAQYREDLKPFKMDYFQERKMRKENPDKWEAMDTARKAIKDRFAAKFGFIEPYITRVQDPETFRFDIFEFDNMRLKKDLDQEADRKYDFIIERTNRIVGEITDATGLQVGAKGDLNGYVIGTRGTAKVQTIGAGGYNIQCYHFRTLINEA